MIYGILFLVLILIITLGAVLIAFYLLPAHGQTVAPPSGGTPPASGTPPAPVSPTVTNVPTPTAPSPNLQYLPQKAYVQSFAPEQGVPANSIPLQAVPPVVAPSPYQQQSNSGFDIGSIMSMIIAGGSGLLAKMGFDKAKTAQNTSQANSETNVKQATIQQKTLEQVYENMGDKGASITNKPEIKLEEVAKVKDEALKTASKA